MKAVKMQVRGSLENGFFYKAGASSAGLKLIIEENCRVRKERREEKRESKSKRGETLYLRTKALALTQSKCRISIADRVQNEL